MPLHLDDPPHDFSPVKDAVSICLSISRAAFSGHICGDANLTLTEPASDENQATDHHQA